MTTTNLVDEAILRASTDTIGVEPDAYLRQCCGRTWMEIRDRLEAGGHRLAAALVQKWCQPDWVRDSQGDANAAEK